MTGRTPPFLQSGPSPVRNGPRERRKAARSWALDFRLRDRGYFRPWGPLANLEP